MNFVVLCDNQKALKFQIVYCAYCWISYKCHLYDKYSPTAL